MTEAGFPGGFVRMRLGGGDIADRGDCERLVRTFYGRVLDDPIIGWIFVDVAKLDVEAHVPQIASFWETILLGAHSYHGGAFRPHAALNARVRLRAGHFERWLALWSTTVDDLFAGDRAELAKTHARRVARAFQARLQVVQGPPPGVGGLAITLPLDRRLEACDDLGVSAQDGTPHWIDLDGAVNARAVVPGVLLRADNLQALSARDVRLLVEVEALEVVVDLRTDVEVELEGPGPITAQPGVRIEQRSLHPDSGGNTDLDADTVKPAGGMDESESAEETPVVRAYMSYLRRRPDSVVGSVRAIARAHGAVLVHCAAGKDRTGVVVALALDAAGADRDTIVADYLATAERINAVIARLVSSSTYRAELEGHDPQRHAPLPGTIERVFELIDERFGGSVGWLSAHGLDEQDVQRLRRRLAPARTSSRQS